MYHFRQKIKGPLKLSPSNFCIFEYFKIPLGSYTKIIPLYIVVSKNCVFINFDNSSSSLEIFNTLGSLSGGTIHYSHKVTVMSHYIPLSI